MLSVAFLRPGRGSACVKRDLWNIRLSAAYSALMFAARMTLAHFSVSAAMSFPNSAGVPGSTVPPRLASGALTVSRDRADGLGPPAQRDQLHTCGAAN
jgi:hypothetical protein